LDFKVNVVAEPLEPGFPGPISLAPPAPPETAKYTYGNDGILYVPVTTVPAPPPPVPAESLYSP